jgi:hypothetical protein
VPDGTHRLQAKTRDAAGNLGYSPVVSVNASNADTTPPTVSITYPGNGATVRPGSSVQITATAADNVGVALAQFYVNSHGVCSDKTSPYTCAWTVPSKPAQQYRIQVVASDTAGNRTIATVNVFPASH